MRGRIAEYSEMIGAFYDCIADSSLWSESLGALTKRFEGVIGTISMLDVGQSTAVFPATWGPAEIIDPLVQTYHAHMPLYENTLRMELDVPLLMGDFFRLISVDGPERFAASRLGQEWALPNDLDYGLCLLVSRQVGRSGNLVINRKAEQGDFRKADVEDLAFLAPHLRRAISISDLFGEQARQVSMFGQIVDNLSSAVLVVTREMAVQYANPVAEELLREGVLLRVAEGKLTFAHAPAEAVVRQAIETGEQQEFAMGNLGICVPASPTPRPLVISVVPLARRAWGDPFSGQSAAIFFGPPRTGSHNVMDVFAALYGLSTAERRVAGLLAEGFRRPEIALACGVRENTVKSQLGAVFEKTGAHGQRALSLLIRDFAAQMVARKDDATSFGRKDG